MKDLIFGTYLLVKLIRGGHIDLDFYLLDGSAFDRYGDHHIPLAYFVFLSRRKLDVHLNHFTLLHLHHFLSFD